MIVQLPDPYTDPEGHKAKRYRQQTDRQTDRQTDGSIKKSNVKFKLWSASTINNALDARMMRAKSSSAVA